MSALYKVRGIDLGHGSAKRGGGTGMVVNVCEFEFRVVSATRWYPTGKFYVFEVCSVV